MKLQLSFLALDQKDFSFIVYRKLYDGAPKTENSLWVYRLPPEPGAKEFTQYYVAFEPTEGFEEYDCPSRVNNSLTKRLIVLMVRDRIHDIGLQYEAKRANFSNGIEITVDTYLDGRRVIVLEPYFLDSSQRFGFLADVRFRANDKHSSPTIETLKLSFSLDRSGNANRSFYADKYKYLTDKLRDLLPKVGQLNWGGLSIGIRASFTTVPTAALNRKQYIFGHNSIEYNQFTGIRRYGPYRPGPQDCTFVFLLEERYRASANKLYSSLTGKSNPDKFTGMHEMFQLNLGKTNIEQIDLLDTSENSLAAAVAQVSELKNKRPNEHIITIFIEENNHTDEPGISETYYYLKYHLTKIEVPLQVLSHENISVNNTLKWSTSNIGLALFTKLGGIPWIVRPSVSDCLILGIGSAHKRSSNGQIERYFAYSVCLDSSGIYRKLAVLADEHSEENYISALQKNLISLLKYPEFANYKKCALHLPFKIKYREIDSIKAAISQVRDIDFQVLKINVKNKFFGYSDHNTRTPHASTLVELNSHEFLVWFEGLQQGKEVLNERISPPVHIEFLRSRHNSREEIYPYLQDVINLTGANWRGFNAKVKVVSIYYSEIIANYCSNFESFHDFRRDMLSLNFPWFL